MKPNIAIQDNARAKIAALLSRFLADECSLSRKTCNADWSIVGTDFLIGLMQEDEMLAWMLRSGLQKP